jgi:hypothetical protein
LRLTPAALADVEATRASFQSAFDGLFALVPQTGLRVTSTADIVNQDGQEITLSGALRLALRSAGRVGVHALAGAAAIFARGQTVEVRLRGSYQFSAFGVTPINETDQVTVTFGARDRVTAGLVGGGLTIRLSGRQSLRVDGRALLSANRATVQVTATPSVAPLQPSTIWATLTDPAVQFSTTTGARSSMSGGTVVDLRTFTGSGLDVRLAITAGYVVKF